VFYTFYRRFIIFEHVIYPRQKCEAGLLLLVGCLVAILREAIPQAVESFYLSFVDVCMSMFSRVTIFE